jgi:hypothetical protein
VSQEDPKSYVRSVPDGELMRRLQRRYRKETPRAPQVAEISFPEAESETARCVLDGESLVALAQNAMGIVSPSVATILAAQVAAMAPRASAPEGPDKNRKLVETSVHILKEIKPEGPLQSMLAVQMIGVHHSATRFLMMATDEAQSYEGADANVHRAVRLMRLFNEQLEALSGLRGKTSEQKVTVEHVPLYEGGQAIVGNVAKGGSLSSGEGRE